MSLVVDNVADYLANNSIGTVGTNIFVGEQPPTPANCVTVLETGGLLPPIDIPSKKPTFQILIRNTNYSTGRTLLDTIRTLLHNKYGVTLAAGGNFFHSINAISEGGHIGKDDAGNDEFSINFQAYVR